MKAFWKIGLAAGLALLFAWLCAPSAQAIAGTSVHFGILGEGVSTSVVLHNTSNSRSHYDQTYGTTRNGVRTTCPPNANYRLQIPWEGSTRLLDPGACRTWSTTGPKTVGVFKADPTPTPTPSPTPSPSPSPSPSGEWPDASNTGYSGSLTTRSGYRVTTAGAVLENQHFTSTLVIAAANVTVRNCRVDAGFFGIEVESGGDGLTVENCTITGGGDSGIASTQADDVTIRRNNISGGADGMKIAGTDVLVEDNYIHDLAGCPSCHNDGIQSYGNGTRLVFRHNYIAARDTSALAMFEGQHTWNDVLVENNYLTGAGYLLYAPGTSGTTVRVLGNTFGTWGWGPVSDWVSKPGNVWSGNVTTSGVPVNR
jgi:hypothetical protein